MLLREHKYRDVLRLWSLPWFLMIVLCLLREKQRQHCSWWRPSPGRAQQPGRIKPEDAPTAQCYQAAQGGWGGEEPHPEQYLNQVEAYAGLP